MDSNNQDHPFVEFTQDGRIIIRASTVAEAKLALKELKLKKKENSITKREITNQQQQIRAGYTDKIRREGTKMRGGGSIGRFVRDFQTSSRNIDKANLARKLAPINKQKSQIDAILTAIDKAVIQVETYILKNS
jgi:hypothetical protein